MVPNKERAVDRLHEECFGKHCEQASVRFCGINSVSKHFIYSTSMYSGPGSSFLFNKKMVTRVESKWNDLISDFHRIKGIIAVLYPVNHAPGVSRTIGC